MKKPELLRKIVFGLVAIGLPLTLLSATIKWYNDPGIPQKTVIAGNEIVSIQQTAPNSYRWALLSDIRTYMAGSGPAPVVNIYVTTVYSTTNYSTNNFFMYLTVQSNAYFFETNFVNYEFTTNLTVVNQTTIGRLIVNSNATFNNTNYNFYEITTNLYVTENLTVNSNLTVNETINVRNLNVTSNITYLTATPLTNVWGNGPTGVLDLALSDQNYGASADMAITGVINKSNNVVQNVMLTIVASGANRTIYLTGAFAESTGATSYVCTSGVPREVWVRYTPAFGGRTNVCSLSFWRP